MCPGNISPSGSGRGKGVSRTGIGRRKGHSHKAAHAHEFI